MLSQCRRQWANIKLAFGWKINEYSISKSSSLPQQVDDNTDSARLSLRPQEQRAWLSGRWSEAVCLQRMLGWASAYNVSHMIIYQPANIIHWANVGLIMAHRLRRFSTPRQHCLNAWYWRKGSCLESRYITFVSINIDWLLKVSLNRVVHATWIQWIETLTM